MKTLAAICLLGLAAGCSGPPSGTSTAQAAATTASTGGVFTRGIAKAVTPCDSDVVSRVTLTALWPKLDTRLNGSTSRASITPERLKRQRDKIACLREWAKTVQDFCQHDEFVKWLDYYSDYADQAAEVMNGKKDSYHDSYEDEQKEINRRVTIYKSTHEVPDPDGKCHED